MAKTLQFRRGNTATVSAITAAEGELLIDTDKDTIIVGDGILPGGFVLARDDKTTSAYNAANAAYNKANTSGGYSVGDVVYSVNKPATGTWLETNKYYSKSSYSSLASALGDVPDFGLMSDNSTTAIPPYFASNNAYNTQYYYMAATDGTNTVLVGGNQSYMLRTVDGFNWYGVNYGAGPNITFYEIRYLNGRFVAIGRTSVGYNYVVWSTDSINWQSALLPFPTAGQVTGDPVSVAYGNGKYVIVGGSGLILYSTDLFNWTSAQAYVTTYGNFYRVQYLNSKFVASTALGYMFSSSDGVTWTISSQLAFTQFYDIAYFGGYYWTWGASASGRVYKSADAVTWTQSSVINSNSPSTIYGLSTNGTGTYVFVCSGGAISYSTDSGTTWNTVTSVVYNSLYDLYQVVWNGTNFVAVGFKGFYLKSPDGITWTKYQDATWANFSGLFNVGTKTIGVKDSTLGSYILDGDTKQCVIPPTSTAWQGLSQAQAQNPSFTSYIAYNGSNTYVAVGSSGYMIASTDNALTWTGKFGGTNQTANYFSVKYLNGNWIAVGAAGMMSSSNSVTAADGTWNTVQGFGSTQYNCIEYGYGYYWIAGPNKLYYTNATGQNLANTSLWTSVTTSGTWNGMAFGNGTLILVGTFGNYAYSTSNTAITGTGTAGSNQFNKIIWVSSLSLFVAVGAAGTIYTTPDGVTWTQRTSNVTGALYDVIWNGTIMVAVGGSGCVTTSPDGVTWTKRNTNHTTGSYQSIAWSGTRFVIVNQTQNWAGYVHSTDGITWYNTSEPTGGTSNPFTTKACNVIYGNNKFVAVGNQIVTYSADGISWYVANDMIQSAVTTVAKSYKFGNTYYIISNAGLHHSSNGNVWATTSRALMGSHVNALAYNGSNTVVAVTGNTGYQAGSIWSSTDYTTFTKSTDVDTMFDSVSTPGGITDVAYANGNFIAIRDFIPGQNSLKNILVSANGVTWTAKDLGFAGHRMVSIAANGNVALLSTTSLQTYYSNIFKSNDGGLTWSRFYYLNGAASTTTTNILYKDGLWVIDRFASTDLVSWYGLPAAPNAFHVYGNNVIMFAATAQGGPGVSKFYYRKNTNYSVPLPSSFPSNSIIANGPREILVKANTAMIPVSGVGTTDYNTRTGVVIDVPLYSYNTSTTFWIPPMESEGVAKAWIYAGA